MASTHTETCLEILEAWIRTRPHLYNLQQHTESIQIILKAGLDSGDDTATEIVTTIVSLGIAEGFDLRDTVNDAGEDDGEPSPGVSG